MRATNRIRIGIAAACLAWSCATSAEAGVLATPGGIRFTYDGPNARNVSVAGTFNDWTSTAHPMVQEAGGLWSVVVRLGAGTHEYKFVVDGQWIADPDNSATVGDYGNSGLALDDTGQIVEIEATANTAYSAKILMSGRSIATYQSIQNAANGGRYELRRPNLNNDLRFQIRMNDALKADVLTNINNESEVEIYRTRLNFDRGLLDFQEEDRRIRAWDNYDVGSFSDPLRLVGDVGIYSHPFGPGTQGAMLEESRWGWTGQLLYADDFADGSTSAPPPDVFYATVGALGDPDTFEFWELQADSMVRIVDTLHEVYDFNATSADEDILAGRVTGPAGPVQLGFSARVDRGYHPATYGFLENIQDRTLALSDSLALAGRQDTVLVAASTADRSLYSGTEQWRGFGGDLAWEDGPGGLGLRTEVLWGTSEFSGRTGNRDQVFVATLPASIVGATRGLFGNFEGDSIITTAELDDFNKFTPLDSRDFEIDESWRFFVGLENLPPVADVRASASVEVQTRDFQPIATGLRDKISNRMWVYRLDLARRIAGRADAALGLEAFDFRYDRRNPWEHQFWFDYRNFWLENDEHVVAFDRLVMLGDDAIFWRPSLDVDVWQSPRIRFEYDGTFAATGLTREPKYTETLLRGSWLVRPQWELGCDLRFVKYNDPILDLNDAYNETFLELKHIVAPGVEIALSYGVDPWALDGPVNEYGYIGRDLFLFARDANAETARDDYFGLARAIRGAENALEAARVLQIEAIMRY